MRTVHGDSSFFSTNFVAYNRLHGCCKRFLIASKRQLRLYSCYWYSRRSCWAVAHGHTGAKTNCYESQRHFVWRGHQCLFEWQGWRLGRDEQCVWVGSFRTARLLVEFEARRRRKESSPQMSKCDQVLTGGIYVTTKKTKREGRETNICRVFLFEMGASLF